MRQRHPSLTQGSFLGGWSVRLHEQAIEFADHFIFTQRRRHPYVSVSGIFRHDGKVYIVTPTDVMMLLDQPRKRRYVELMRQLLERLTASDR